MEEALTKVEEECVRKIAEAKSISRELVTLDATLDSLEVDSLDRVTLSFDLEEKYGVEIPDTKLHQIRTVRDVALAVEHELTKGQLMKVASPGAA